MPFNDAITLVAMPDECRSIPITAPNDWNPSTRVAQGSEFVSKDLDIWVYQKGVALDFSQPGKFTDNSSLNPTTANSEANA